MGGFGVSARIGHIRCASLFDMSEFTVFALGAGARLEVLANGLMPIIASCSFGTVSIQKLMARWSVRLP